MEGEGRRMVDWRVKAGECGGLEGEGGRIVELRKTVGG